MDIPEKLATQGTQDGRKTKQKHNTICEMTNDDTKQ
jgi:hypothetical protein